MTFFHRRAFSSITEWFVGRAMTTFLFLMPIAVLAFVMRDMIFFDRFFFNNDIILNLLPYLAYRGAGGQLIMQGILSGFPLFVSTGSAWFNTVAAMLFSRFSATHAYVILTIGNLLLTYGFSYLYARIIGLSRPAAILAAMTFMFSGQVALWASSTINTGYYFILPATLYLFELAISKERFARVGLLGGVGLLLGFGWLSAHVQFVVYIHTFFFVYALVRIHRYGNKNWQVTVLSLGIPYVISAFIGLPVIGSILSFQHETLRSGGVSLVEYAGSGFMPWDFIHYLSPFWNVSFLSVASPNLYLGVLPFLILAIALFSYKELENRYAALYVWTFVFCLLASIRYSPVAIALHYLPFWNAFREAPRIMFVGGFAEAMVVGIGFEYIYAQWNTVAFYRLRVVRIVAYIFVYVALPTIVLFSLVRAFYFTAIETRLDQYFLEHTYAHTTQLPVSHYLAVINTYLHQILDQFSLYDPQILFALLFIMLALVFFRFQKYSPLAYVSLIVVGVAGLNFASVYAIYYPSVASSGISSPPQTAFAIFSRQKDNPSPYRVFSIFPAMTVYN
ncbi:MAG: hypothetical protein WAW90_00315, partial [Minisyncoccia bacterium]